MYSLDLEDYEEEFYTISELISDALQKGIDPSAKVTRDGKLTHERLEEFIVP